MESEPLARRRCQPLHQRGVGGAPRAKLRERLAGPDEGARGHVEVPPGVDLEFLLEAARGDADREAKRIFEPPGGVEERHTTQPLITHRDPPGREGPEPGRIPEFAGTFTAPTHLPEVFALRAEATDRLQVTVAHPDVATREDRQTGDLSERFLERALQRA